MRISKLNIIDFNGIKDAEILFNENLCFIVSDNNIGKTRVLESINAFYTIQPDCEINIEYELNDEDINNLKIKLKDENFKERNIVIKYKNKKHSFNEMEMKKYVEDKTFGDLIYIPAVSNHEQEVDMSKTSTIISKNISGLLAKSDKLNSMLSNLNVKLTEYMEEVKNTSKEEIEKFSDNIIFENIKLIIEEKNLDNTQMIKNNITLRAKDDGEIKEISQLGTGIQRNIVNSILSNGINDGFTIILYDEPETFLNIKAQRQLMSGINKNNDKTQYIISTHSPDIIYRSPDIFNRIIKLQKDNKSNIKVYQFDEAKYKKQIKKINKFLTDKGCEEKYKLKENINETILAWWDRDRINAMFEDKVLIVEGPTEEIFIDMFLRKENISYICTASGKFSIPYFEVFLNKIFNIKLYVLYDKDDETKCNHKIFNEYINRYIINNVDLINDFEEELGYKKEEDKKEDRRKPQKLLEKYFNKELKEEKIEMLKNKILELWGK